MYVYMCYTVARLKCGDFLLQIMPLKKVVSAIYCIVQWYVQYIVSDGKIRKLKYWFTQGKNLKNRKIIGSSGTNHWRTNKNKITHWYWRDEWKPAALKSLHSLKGMYSKIKLRKNTKLSVSGSRHVSANESYSVHAVHGNVGGGYVTKYYMCTLL
jgi:hypothetical protein